MPTSPERMTRRAMVYDQRVVPHWASHVDGVTLELLSGVDLGMSPTLLIAECRTGHLVQRLSNTLPEGARLMVVDPSSEMLDLARKRLADAKQKVFYSTQQMTKLSYADGVFHAVLCNNGLVTKGDLQLAGKELLRVLKPDGLIGLTVPLNTTFSCFPDLLREALLKLEMRDVEHSLDAYVDALLTNEQIDKSFLELGLDIIGRETIEFELEFENAEDFLFSPFVEGVFLPRWLAVCNDPDQREPLFFDIVRSINKYFKGLTFPTKVALVCVLAKRG